MSAVRPGRRPLEVATVSRRNRLGRLLWQIVWLTLYRPSPVMLHGWRRMLLRAFGAVIEPHAKPYPNVRIFAPWNLTMREGSCLGRDVDCYCVAAVELGAYSTVSQYSFLCTASHDVEHPDMPLVVAPITLGADVWVAADVFVGPGVRVGDGALIAARATVVRDVEAWTVVVPAAARVVGVRQSVRRRRIGTRAGDPAPPAG